MEDDEVTFDYGEKLLLKWPLEGPEEKRRWEKVKVVRAKKCKETKNGSSYKYTLEFYKDPSMELIETRLLHLEWKRPGQKEDKVSKKEAKSNKRPRSNSLDKQAEQAVAPIPRPIKKGKLTSIGSIPLSALRYILAPMVGASELPFRLLCRKYGSTLAYTPMMLSSRFAHEEKYRSDEFQTCTADRPLVAHFAANVPADFAAAAKLVQHQCDAIDLNLGCPQRVAHAGHFGSFLLDEADRALVLSLVRSIAEDADIRVPIFVKIRLLSTPDETLRLCRQLIEAGAAVIAIHARHRVNLVARSGATARDGPALLDQVRDIRQTLLQEGGRYVPIIANGNIRAWTDVEQNLAFTKAEGVMSAEGILDNPALFHHTTNTGSTTSTGIPVNKLQLATEYLDLVDRYPTKLKSVVFHLRRMCRQELEQYQLLQECLAAENVATVRSVVQRMQQYAARGDFVFDPLKEKKEKEAEARRKAEEGKRKDFEARMVRKAKREGKPLDHYLSQGAATPTRHAIAALKALINNNQRDKAFQQWKEQHSQHCWTYHFEAAGCGRDRKCAFLHADPLLDEDEGQAGGNEVPRGEMEVYG